jgi:hypothetical protein
MDRFGAIHVRRRINNSNVTEVLAAMLEHGIPE